MASLGGPARSVPTFCKDEKMQNGSTPQVKTRLRVQARPTNRCVVAQVIFFVMVLWLPLDNIILLR